MSIIQSLYGEEHEYKVIHCFSGVQAHRTERGQHLFSDLCKKILTSDFAHLIITEGNDTMVAENVCSAAGKEDNIAVEKETG